MLNKIKIICADLLEMKNEKTVCRKENDKLLDAVISDTAGGNFPEGADVIKLEKYIERELFAIETIQKKIDQLKALSGAASVEQMRFDDRGEK